jgi:hypothetical protein
LKRWKKYTQYEEIQTTPVDIEMKNEEFSDFHKNKAETEVTETDLEVGAMNEGKDIDKILTTDQYLSHPHDIYNNKYINTEMKENVDFMILSDAVWTYLYDIYGG